MGANFPGRVDVVGMLKRWWRVPVRTRVAVGTGQDQAPAGHQTAAQRAAATVTRCPFSGGQ